MSRSWLKPCSTKEMPSAEAAWLAGFFDGEGSVTVYLAGRNRAYPTYIISIPNTHKGSLDRCVEITGVGKVVSKNMKNKPDHYKQQWQWQVQSQRNIASVCLQMLPYCCIKQDKIRECLTFYEQLPELAQSV
jgi:hypothetical protein